MTNKVRLFIAAAMVAMLGTSCSEDQTSMNLEDIPGQAVVSGYLTSNAGEEYVNNTRQNKIIIAAAEEVLISVNNSTLVPNAQGVTTYKVTTDSQGKFSQTIPVTLSTQVTITPLPYDGKSYSVESVPATDPTGSTTYTTKTKNAIFECAPITVTLNPGESVIKDMQYNYRNRN
ncbi:hypothetical protein [Bacteroides sp.]